MAKATATDIGYFGTIRQPGDVFEVPDGTKSNSWFQVDGEASEPAAPKGKKAQAQASEPAADESVI